MNPKRLARLRFCENKGTNTGMSSAELEFRSSLQVLQAINGGLSGDSLYPDIVKSLETPLPFAPGTKPFDRKNLGRIGLMFK